MLYTSWFLLKTDVMSADKKSVDEEENEDEDNVLKKMFHAYRWRTPHSANITHDHPDWQVSLSQYHEFSSSLAIKLTNSQVSIERFCSRFPVAFFCFLLV